MRVWTGRGPLLARFDVKLWNPDLHPRDPRTGRFVRRAGSGVRLPKGRVGIARDPNVVRQLRRLRSLSDDDLFDLFSRITNAEHFDEPALLKVAAEMDRREADAGAAIPEDTPEQKRIDQLVARGWDYLDAYADVYGLDPEQLRAQQERTLVDKRKGETRRQAVRRAYDEYVALQLIAAEDATRGHLLSAAGRSRGIDPVTLFSGNAARARKYASEDLLRWWENNQRVTFAAFQSRVSTRPRHRRAAERARLAGNGRDFGV